MFLQTLSSCTMKIFLSSIATTIIVCGGFEFSDATLTHLLITGIGYHFDARCTTTKVLIAQSSGSGHTLHLAIVLQAKLFRGSSFDSDRTLHRRASNIFPRKRHPSPRAACRMCRRAIFLGTTAQSTACPRLSASLTAFSCHPQIHRCQL